MTSLALRSAWGYAPRMRVNFLALGALMLLLGLTRLFLNHDPWMGGAFVLLAGAFAVSHVIRVRRFRRYDQSKTFD